MDKLIEINNWNNPNWQDWENEEISSDSVLKIISLAENNTEIGIALDRVLQIITKSGSNHLYLPIILKLYQKCPIIYLHQILDWAKDLDPHYFKLFYLVRSESKLVYNLIWISKIIEIRHPMDRRSFIRDLDLEQIELFWTYWLKDKEDYHYVLQLFVGLQSFLPKWDQTIFQLDWEPNWKPVSGKRIYIDMDDTICQYRQRHKQLKTENPNLEWPQSVKGFFSGLDPINDAIKSVKMLAEHNEIWFLTRPSVKNLHCYTEKAEWIQKWFGEEWLDRLIICPNKTLLIGDILIDDSIYFGNIDFQGHFIHFNNGMTWTKVLTKLIEPITD